MSSNFPSSVDVFPSAATLAADTLGSGLHDQRHGDLGDAVSAVEAALLFHSVGGPALLASTDYGCLPGAGVHNNGPKLQNFIDGALSTGRVHYLDIDGAYLLESAAGVPYIPVIDLSTAVFAKTVIVFAPGAVLTAPNAFGKPDKTLTSTTSFTGASRATKVVTLTVPSGHGLVAGDNIEVYCPTWDFDSGDFTVTSVTATTIVYTQNTTVGTNFTSGAAGSHGGFINCHVSCLKVIGGSVGSILELWRPQFNGPSSATDPNATPISCAVGSGPTLSARVESHGLVSTGFRNGLIIAGSDGANTDHFHHNDIKQLSGNFYGLYVRDLLQTGTRDFRFDNGGYGPNQRAGWGVSISGYLPDFVGNEQHFNANPYAILKEGFRGVTLPSGGSALLFDDAEWGGGSKAEGSGNGAWNCGEGTCEKVGGTFRFHGIEINGAGSGSFPPPVLGPNHTLRDIGLTALTRSTTIVSATYSRTSSGASTVGSCVITGLTANAFGWKDVGCELVKTGVPAGALIVAVLSTTSVLISDAATGASTSTCYSVPRLQVGDHIAVFTDADAGVTLNRSAVIKTLSGTGTWATGGAGPFTLTAETVGESGTIASTAATAGCVFGWRAGIVQHVAHLAFLTKSDPSTEYTASEGYWDFVDLDVCRFIQPRHPNASTGYSCYPSVNLRNGSTSSLRTVFVHGDDEVMLVKALNAIAAGQCTEIGAAGSRKLSTVSSLHLRGGEALQPADTTTSHPTGATQTTRPYFWVTRKGSFRASSGWPGVKVTGTPASGDLLVEDSGTPGSCKTRSATGQRIIGTATGAAAGGVCPYEVIQGESWST